ncbi:MAG: hypothetical protein AAGA54_07710 [Myxococcota bacterium]
MQLEATPMTPSLPRFSNHAFVDEEAVTLRLRPLRWRDRVLPGVLPWSGAAATIAAVACSLFTFATPSEAAQIESEVRPVMTPMVKTPVLAEASVKAMPEAIEDEDDEDDVIIILEDEDDDIVIFDEDLDAPSAAALATLHMERNEHELALQYALQAVDAQPRNAAHHALLATAYRHNGDRKASRRASRRARRLRR